LLLELEEGTWAAERARAAAALLLLTRGVSHMDAAHGRGAPPR